MFLPGFPSKSFMSLLIPAFALAFAASATAQQAEPKTSVMEVPGGKIEITLPDEPMTLKDADLLQWVKTSATAVSTYYGHFPVPNLTLRMRAGNGARIGRATTYPRRLIVITVGREATTQALNEDWVLVHEMVHLAFPNMAEEHHWIEEGLSTYVEPVARAQIGQMPVAEVWSQFVRDMSRGQPGPDDQGLDVTHTWGRTYWGGAMFCLLADVGIRERTHNAKGLQDALRAIVQQGGNISEDWEIEKALTIGDTATGTKVLRNLYTQMKDKPSPVDLDQLWIKLGVKLAQDGAVVFNDKAAGAAIRRAITAPRNLSNKKGARRRAPVSERTTTKSVGQ
jgi:hypothetical protein